MANVVTQQILEDGQLNHIVKVEMLLDTSDMAETVIIDVSALSSMGDLQGACSRVNIKRIIYDIEDTLTVNLFWDAIADVSIWRLVGRGVIDLKKAGGLKNNAGAGVTGDVSFTTQGWSGGAILAASFTIECTKS